MEDKFFKQLKQASTIDDKMDIVFDTFDNLLIDCNYEQCDLIISKMFTHTLNPNLLVGVLTITHRYKDNLLAREVFYQKTMALLVNNTSLPEAIKILDGLW